MKVVYAVTFEFARQAPKTHRGIAEGGRVHTCVARAVRDAQAALRATGWSSMNCVVLERIGDEESEPADAELEPAGHV